MGNLKFYRDEPLFGLDVGHDNIKAMQIEAAAGKPLAVKGYGLSSFDSSAIQNGVIIKPDVIAAAMHELFDKNIVGAITSRRVACAIPTSHTFSRPMKLPVLDHEAILEAVHLEAEQYIPIPITNLYLDYEVSHQDASGIELLLVAVSKNIVDSYHKTLEALKLEPVAFEPSINAASRLLQTRDVSQDQPAIIVDIGSVTTDIAVFDKTLLVASAVNGGGDNIAELIAKSLKLSPQQAMDLKNEYGISYSERQQRVIDAIKPILETLTHEIQKSIRYYSERAAKSGRQISQIITIGGGSVMPGLNQYLSKELRLPTQGLDPWQKVDFGSLAQPPETNRAMYVIAAGEALLNPAEVLK
jgi:type IV pilus assembly protein PilM